MRVDMYAQRRMPQNPMNLHIRLQSRLGWFGVLIIPPHPTLHPQKEMHLLG